jgi:hypothetical protein
MIQLKDIIHFYIGCEVLIDGKEVGRLYGINTSYLKSINQIHYDIQTEQMRIEDGEDFVMPYNDDFGYELRIKPILRRLEDITDEEFKSYLNWDRLNELYENVRYEKCERAYILTYNIPADIGSYPMSVTVDFIKLLPDQFLWLIKHGFDLFNLIESGQAIDAKTWNQNK